MLFLWSQDHTICALAIIIIEKVQKLNYNGTNFALLYVYSHEYKLYLKIHINIMHMHAWPASTWKTLYKNIVLCIV